LNGPRSGELENRPESEQVAVASDGHHGEHLCTDPSRLYPGRVETKMAEDVSSTIAALEDE